MKEIVVARSSTGPFSALIYVSLIIVVGRGWAIWWPVRFLFFAVVFAVAINLLNRMRNMKLSVTPEQVHVVNFNSKFALDINSVRIDDQNNPNAWPQNDLVPAEALGQNAASSSGARELMLTDDTGVKANVGVAPSYGSRLDEIAEDLYIAIDRMRAAS